MLTDRQVLTGAKGLRGAKGLQGPQGISLTKEQYERLLASIEPYRPEPYEPPWLVKKLLALFK